jgi:ABC-2 type transport system ATP-binding protein
MLPVVQVFRLFKSYGKKSVLKDVSFSLFKGDILGIIGPNGAGKTTLLYILLGIIEPTSGEVKYFGRPLKKDRSKILKRVGFASNYVSLPYSLTVEENLKVFAHLYEVKDYRRRIDEVLQTFKLADKKKALCRALSTGEMMRLNLARAFLHEPDVLLLDEPTAGLDPEYMREVAEFLKKQAEERGLSIILTSHQLSELEKIANKLLLIKEGRILAFGGLEELFKLYGVDNLEELYFKAFSNSSLGDSDG